MNFIASFSGGKDSMLAVSKMIEQGHNCSGLMTTTNEDIGSWFHDIDINILKQIATELGVNFYQASLKQESYSEMFEESLKKIKKNNDFDAVVFGDIDIQDHRDWCTQRCENIGVKAIFPLWQMDRITVVEEFINQGYQALIKRVDKNKLSKESLGKTLDNDLMNYFAEINIDVCGENGEYHTLVFNGPLFKKTVPLKLGKIIETENSYVLEVKLDEK